MYSAADYRQRAARALRFAAAFGPGLDADRMTALAAEYDLRAADLDAVAPLLSGKISE